MKLPIFSMLSALTLIAGVTIAASASATPVTILSLSDGVLGAGTYVENGFTVTVTGSGSIPYSSNGYSPSDGGGGYTYLIIASDGGGFTFVSIDLADPYDGPGSVHLTGTLKAGGTATDVLTGGAEHTANAVQLAGDTLASLQIGSFSTFMSFKNVIVDEASPSTPAPEPASLALMGTALVGFALRRGRRGC